MTQNSINNTASTMDIANIKIAANTISSTNPNGNIILDPNGTGKVSVPAPMDVSNLNIDGNTISSTDANGNIILAPDGTGEISVTAAPIIPSTNNVDSLGSASNSWGDVFAKGITFDGGTNILSSFVDTTSFQPTLEFGGASVGIVYTVRVGQYSRIGNFVFLQINVRLSNKGTSTGVATITGTVLDNSSLTTVPFACNWTDISFNAQYTVVSPIIRVSSNLVELEQVGGNSTPFINLTDSNFGNDSGVLLSGVYLTQ